MVCVVLKERRKKNSMHNHLVPFLSSTLQGRKLKNGPNKNHNTALKI